MRRDGPICGLLLSFRAVVQATSSGPAEGGLGRDSPIAQLVRAPH